MILVKDFKEIVEAILDDVEIRDSLSLDAYPEIMENDITSLCTWFNAQFDCVKKKETTLDDLKDNCKICGCPIIGEEVCSKCKSDLTNEHEVFD